MHSAHSGEAHVLPSPEQGPGMLRLLLPKVDSPNSDVQVSSQSEARGDPHDLSNSLCAAPSLQNSAPWILAPWPPKFHPQSP